MATFGLQKGRLKKHVATLHQNKKPYDFDFCGAIETDHAGGVSNIDYQPDKEIKEESNSSNDILVQKYDIHSEIDIKEEWHLEEQNQLEENTNEVLDQPTKFNIDEQNFQNLNTHVAMIHEKERPFECSKCPKAFCWKRDLKRHESTVHEGQTYECEECGKSFGDKSNLNRHVTNVHNIKTRTFECPKCSRNFNRKSHLEKHVYTVHGGQKPYKRVVSDKPRLYKQHFCHEPGCNKVYARTSHLHAHLSWHRGERPFVCNFCEKRFTRSDELQRHRRTHTGEKLFVCPECNKKFMRRDHLSKHIKTHQKDTQSIVPTDHALLSVPKV